MSGWYEIAKSDKGQYSFVLKAANSQVILRSEQYASKASVQGGVASVQTNSPREARYELATAKDGRSYFNLKAANGQVIGTDTTGRDIFARLFYGFRIAIFFSLAFMVLTYLVGITIGCLMGYYGGVFDLIVQRLIEIWSNIPFLYMVIILFSVVPSTFSIPARIGLLLVVMVLFSWTSMTYYMRTATYREKARDYTAAATVLGAGAGRIIFHHILPNTISTIVTFMPFTVVSAITAITALDFLGFGLPPPTPSMGELLKQGTQTLTTAPWIVSSAFAALVFILILVTFIGEAVREAFDPKKFTTYQ